MNQRFLIVRHSPLGLVETEAYYASDIVEAQRIAAEQSDGVWLICVVVDEAPRP